MNWPTKETFAIYFILTMYGILLIYIAVLELAACFRRRRSAAVAKQILDSVPDIPYLPLPHGDGQQEASSSSCVICIAEYAGGEGRFVMPGCGHVFHRGCIAEWLRQGKTTCPVCRAAAVIVVAPPAAGDEKVVAAASTAEDMV